MENPYSKDLQLTAIRGARRYLPDRLTRIAAPHKLLDPDAGPLIAVKLHILTRKSLGGLPTDLDGRVLGSRRGAGPRSLRRRRGGRLRGRGYARLPGAEGTFLGGCLFLGRIAGRARSRPLAERGPPAELGGRSLCDCAAGPEKNLRRALERTDWAVHYRRQAPK